MQVKEELTGRPFIVTRREKNKIVQDSYTLHSGLTDSEIRRRVQSGVDINCFETVPTLALDAQEKAWKGLEAFAVKVTDNAKRVQDTVRTTLIPVTESMPGVIVLRQPVANNDGKILKLVKAGVSFDEAEKLVEASAEELENIDYKVAGKALGLKGNYGAGKVYEAIHA